MAEAGFATAEIEWQDPVVSDNSNQDVTLGSNIPSGSVLSVGIHNVTYTATDIYGNTASCSFTVTVIGNVFFFYFIVIGVFKSKMASHQTENVQSNL